MTKKRRNGGRSRHGRGHTRLVDCDHCGCKPAKDKAIKRFLVRNIVDSGALNDLKAATALESYTLPKFYTKKYHCVSCAVHSRIVRVRSTQARRIRVHERKRRPRREDKEKKTTTASA